MKKFDLRDMLNGAKVQTRDGREVFIAGYLEKAQSYEKILGWIVDPEGIYSQSWFEHGQIISDRESLDDLMMID